MDLVKDDLSGMANSPESGNECEGCDDGECDFVFQVIGSSRAVGLCKLVELVLDSHGGAILLLRAGHVSLAQAFGGHGGPVSSWCPI